MSSLVKQNLANAGILQGQSPTGSSGFGSPVGIGTGFVKEVMDRPRSAAAAGNAIGDWLANTGPGKWFTQNVTKPIVQSLNPETQKAVGQVARDARQTLDYGVQRTGLTELNTGAEKLGGGIENVAEFFLPGGAVEKGVEATNLAMKGAKLGELGADVARTLGGGEKFAQFAGKVAEKAPGLLARASGEGLVSGGVTALQSGGEDMKDIGTNAALGAGFGLVSPFISMGAKRLFPWLSDAAQRSTLRLTPAKERDLGSKIDDVVNFLSEKKVIGTPKRRFEIVSDMYNNAENQIQNVLKNDAVGRTVNKQELVNDIVSIADNYRNDRDYLAIKRQLQGAADSIAAQFPEEIPLDALNEFKRSTYKGAYNKAGEKVLDTVEHDIGDVVYKKLSDAAEGLTINGKPLREFNRDYSTIINAKKMLKTAMSRKQSGFLAKLISSIAGSSLGTAIGGPVGAAVGSVTGPAAVEHLGGTLTRSIGALGLKKAAQLVPEASYSLPKLVPGVNQFRKKVKGI